MSLLLALIFELLTSLDFQSEIRQLFSWSATYNLIQFIVTIIPIRYPRWIAAYNGMPSDGLQLLQQLRR